MTVVFYCRCFVVRNFVSISSILKASMNELLLVEDVNDNAPVFEANYTINITENSSTGIRLLKVIANDADKGINGIVVFSVQKIEANTAAAVRNI